MDRSCVVYNIRAPTKEMEFSMKKYIFVISTAIVLLSYQIRGCNRDSSAVQAGDESNNCSIVSFDYCCMILDYI